MPRPQLAASKGRPRGVVRGRDLGVTDRTGAGPLYIWHRAPPQDLNPALSSRYCDGVEEIKF